MKDEYKLNFFISTPHKCGYLADRQSVSLFADPEYPMTPDIYSVLIDHGFRRSGNYVYRPECPRCHACIPVRIDVSRFAMNRSQKRVWNKNQDLVVTEVKPEYRSDHFELYQKYQLARHGEGDMARHDMNRYIDFLKSRWCNTVFYEFRLADKLVAVAVVDFIKSGLSAFYTFFDPEHEKRSLGTYIILWQIRRARQLALSWLYLGYWINDCAKMNYKEKFQPLEMFVHEKWEPFDKGHVDSVVE